MMNTMRKSISLLLTLLLTFSLVSVATAEGNPVLEGVYDLEKNDFGMETFTTSMPTAPITHPSSWAL